MRQLWLFVKSASLALLATVALVFCSANLHIETTHAAPTYTINYQGKLTNNTGAAVADGLYDMEFKLYDAVSGGTTLWTETRTGGNQVQVTNGLFSVMLGDVTSLTSVDFNQALYLGVNIDSDGEMSPRKALGTVPSAFEARQLGGVASSSFLRSDQDDTASGLLTFSGGFISSASSTISQLSTGTSTITTLVIDGETVTDLTGTGITNVGGALTLDATGDWTGTFDGQEGSWYLANSFSTSSADYWETQQTSRDADDLSNNSIQDLSDVAAMTESTGDLLSWNGSAWTNVATSSLGIGGSITADSLDFTEFADSMTLDANTTFDTTASYGLTLQSGIASINLGGDSVVISSTNYDINDTAFRAPNGAVGTPAFSFANDTNTGIFSAAADTLAFSTNAAERLRIDASGNVGIGETVPADKLHVDGTIRIESPVNDYGLLVRGSTGQSSGFWDAAGDADLYLRDDTGNLGVLLRSDSSSYLNGGDVGIGTTTPGAKLDVYDTNGVIRISGTGGGNRSLISTLEFYNYFADQQVAQIRALRGLNDLNAGQLTFLTSDDSGVMNEQMTITKTGNVGIGTTTPTTKLHVAGQTTISGGVLDLDTGQPIRWGGGASAIYGGSGLSDLAVVVGSNERIRINGNSGNVGIGDISPASLFTVGNGDLFQINSSGQVVAGSWQASTISSSYLDSNVLLSSEIDTSAELRAILSDETGTGAAVFGTSPTITTPTLSGTTTIDGAGVIADGSERAASSLNIRADRYHYLELSAIENSSNEEYTILQSAGNSISLFTGDVSRFDIDLTGRVRVGNSGTINSATGSGDLYVQDFLEVDGNATFNTVTAGTWQGSTISSTYLDSNVILSSEIDSSAELRAILTDETGTGAAVFNISPTFVGTPRSDGLIIAENSNVGELDLNNTKGYVIDNSDITGGWARGLIAENGAATQAGAGFLGSASSTSSFNIGFGSSWWSSPDAAFTVLSSGNVGIGDISPASLFTVGNGDLFQVNSSGQVVSGSWQGSAVTDSYVSDTLTIGSGSTINGQGVSNFIYGDNGSGSMSAPATQDFSDVSMYKSGFWDVFGASWTPDTGWWWGQTNAHISNSGSYLYGSQTIFRNSLTPSMYIRGITGGGTPTAGSWQQVWTEGTDGAGSGLDADLLDGVSSNQIPYALSSGAGGGILGTTNTFTGDGGIGADNIARSMFFRDNSGQFGSLGIHIAHSNNANYALQLVAASYSGGALQYRHKNNGVWTSPETIWSTANDGASSGLDADLLDGVEGGSYLRSDTNDTYSGGRLSVYTPASTQVASATGGLSNLEVFQANAGTDALMTFHVSGDYAVHFGLDGGLNDLVVGGYSMGANAYRIWHEGNDGTSSGLDADTLDGLSSGSFAAAFSNSAGLAGLLSDETGTGAAVFAGSPTLTGTVNAANLTLSGDLQLGAGSQLQKVVDGNFAVIDYPQGGSTYNNNSTVTGAIEVTLPVYRPSDMMKLVIDVYDYTNDESFTVIASGYNYSSGWINTSVQIIGSKADRDFTVRFGDDGSNSKIWIGELGSTWSYPQVVVREVLLGYTSNIANYSGNWSVGFEATAFDTVSVAVSDNFPIAGTLAAQTSAELRAILTDETGSGAAVFADSPTFTGTLNTANLSATGKITGSTPALYSAITSVVAAPFEVPELNTGTGGFAPMLHGKTLITGGYRKHVSIGSYRTGTGWGGGIYFGQGDNDNNPTEYFLMEQGGTLSHSSGAMTMGGTVNFSRITLDDGANFSIDSNPSGLLFDGGDGTLDFLVYDETAYTDNVTFGYNGTANINTYDSNESLVVTGNGSGIFDIQRNTNMTGSLGVAGQLTLTSVFRNDVSGTDYDVWIQGGTGSGDTRNLALLGIESTDQLILNYNSEYDCVSIGSTGCSASRALDVNGAVNIAGAITGATWNGAAITDGYLVKTGNWTGTLDGVDGASFLRSDTSDTFSGGRLTIHTPAGTDVASGVSTLNNLEVYQATAGTDALMTFHVSGDYAVHFGLDGGINDLVVGGYSMGTNSYRIWHQGNDGSGSTLDADTLDGLSSGSFLTSTAGDWTGTFDGADGSLYGRLDQNESVTAKWDFTGGIIGASYGIDGRYSNVGGNNSFGSTIWSLDSSWQGSASGNTYTASAVYGMSWLRSGNSNADANVGEGLYVYQNGVYQGGVGTVGIETTGALNVGGAITLGGVLSGATEIRLSAGTEYSIGTNASGLIFDGGDGSADFLVYDEAIYADVLYLGYGGSALLTPYDTGEILQIQGNGTGDVFLNDDTGVGVSDPDKRLEVFETVADDQFRISYDASRYADFQVTSVGDLVIDAQGGDVTLGDENLFICSGGSCASTPNGTGNITAERAITSEESTLSSSGSITVNWDDGNQQYISSTGNLTIAFSNNTDGQTLRIVICYGGAHSVTWPAGVKWTSGTEPAETATSGRCDVFSFVESVGGTLGAATLNIY